MRESQEPPYLGLLSVARSFAHFCQSLQKHAYSVGTTLDACYCEQNHLETRYWICFMSNNQWKIQEELGTESPSHDLNVLSLTGCSSYQSQAGEKTTVLITY